MCITIFFFFFYQIKVLPLSLLFFVLLFCLLFRISQAQLLLRVLADLQRIYFFPFSFHFCLPLIDLFDVTRGMSLIINFSSCGNSLSTWHGDAGRAFLTRKKFSNYSIFNLMSTCIFFFFENRVIRQSEAFPVFSMNFLSAIS